MKSLLFAALALLFTTTACLPVKPTMAYDVFPGQATLPQEEAPHSRNSLEWWYFTGHLKDQASGQSYGVEYVFFHFNSAGEQDWQMVNFALSDPKTQQFRYDYKLAKSPTLLPSTLPLSLSLQKDQQTWQLSGQEGRYRLQARMVTDPKVAIDLTTTPTKPVLLHGAGTGYEKYGPVAQAGYYSYPRLATTGTIEVDGQPRQVTGELWYDRQWNCGGVNRKEIAWDWLSIQLDTPREELMLYHVHNKKTKEHIYGGTHNSAESQSIHLNAPDFTLEPLDYWPSAQTGRRYPARWRVQVPSQGYDLVVEPLIPNQELQLALFPGINLNYWEGMCRVTGTHRGQPVTGQAYVELTNR